MEESKQKVTNYNRIVNVTNYCNLKSPLSVR